MKKRQTIFKKYLMISMLVIFVGFTVLGVMIVFFATQNWQTERWETLQNNALTISSAVSEYADIGAGEISFGEPGGEIIRLTMSTLSTGLNSDILITDKQGNIVLYSDNSVGIDTNKTISEDYVKRAMTDTIYEMSDLAGFYGDNFYIVGVPVQGVTESGIEPIGTVFVTSSASHYKDYVITIVKIFCSAGIVIFALIFSFVGIFSYQLTKPLQQMAKAAKAFGNGDFSKRVKADGNDEIGDLARAFNTMADSLAASEGMRRSFIANVSHELKTPMTTIAGFIDGILDGTIPKERQNYYLNIVTVEVKRLSRLVTSMLALSRIDSGELKMQTRKFNISDTVLTTFLTFEQKIDERKIEIHGLEDNPPLYIEGDPDMIHQVVYNLVENATKFTNIEGRIDVAIEDKNTDVWVSITNTGPGIPPEQIGYIFDRFYKTDKSRSMDKNGMGLGLFIVKTIIQLHGGEISAESEEGKYTRFKFRLPKKTENEKKRSLK
ncbi:MAG: HAMP domain-containing histidine kinase [Clostridia bacterium]|nr:HAMP domain-containing histidine kinase [Clostridia bacterium]